MKIELYDEKDKIKRDAFIKVTRETRATAGLGSTVFDDAVKYYNVKNPTYKGIKGRWEGADPQYADGMSDNFIAFKDAKLINNTP